MPAAAPDGRGDAGPESASNDPMSASSDPAGPLGGRNADRTKDADRTKGSGRTKDADPTEGSGRTKDAAPTEGSGRTKDADPAKGSGRTKDADPTEGSGRTKDADPTEGSGRTKDADPTEGSGRTKDADPTTNTDHRKTTGQGKPPEPAAARADLAVAWVRMPDEASAQALKKLIDEPGSGDIDALRRDGGPGRDPSFTGQHYASVVAGDLLMIAEAAPANRGPATFDDDALARLLAVVVPGH
jgi:hypothetical protein